MRIVKYIFCFIFFFLLCLCMTYATGEANESFLNNPSTGGFTENKGQITDQYGRPNNDVRYLVSLGNMNVQLRKNGFSYDLFKPNNNEGLIYFHRIDITFEGADSNPQIVAEGASLDFINYYTSAVPNGALGVKTYKKITYRNIYPNIDVEFMLDDSKSNQVPVKYNFIVNPGGDVSKIELKYEGQNQFQINSKGNLKIENSIENFEETIPCSYQINHLKKGKKIPVKVVYQQKGNKIGFACGAYDRRIPLIIDPVPSRVWGTYYGGAFDDKLNGLCKDSVGNIYLVGTTFTTGSATNAIATAGAYQTSFAGAGANGDIFLVKFNKNGTRKWGTYCGGSGNDGGYAIAMDLAGDLVITGQTSTSNFPNAIVTAGTEQTLFGGGTPAIPVDVFIMKFDTLGMRKWGTYYGGAGNESGMSITTDKSKKIIITGFTTSSGTAPNKIASSNCFQSAYGGASFIVGDAYVAKFNEDGTRDWSTYYGGASDDMGNSVAVDENDDIIITGVTFSSGSAPNAIASSDAHQSSFGGGALGDCFVAKFTSGGTRVWGTYYGGSGDDAGFGIATDATENIYVCGSTKSTGLNVISTNGAHQTNFASTATGGSDAFICKFDPNGARQWGTYYGGGQDDVAKKLTLDEVDNVYVVGYTRTTGFAPNGIATANAYQTSYAGGATSGDAFILKMDNSGTRYWCSYYGGTQNEISTDVMCDNNYVYLLGYTTSSGGTIIASTGAHQTVFGGGTNDGFLVKFNPCPSTPTVTAGSDTSLCGLSNYTINAYGAISYQWTPVSYLNSSTGNSVVASPPYSIPISYTVTGTDAYGCSNDTSITIALYSLPTLTGPVPQTICAGIDLELSVSGAASYIWTPDNYLSDSTGGIDTLSAPVGIHSYSVIGTDLNNCADTSLIVVTVNSNPTASAGSDMTLCSGDNVTLNASGGISYTWQPSSGLSSTNTATISANPATTTEYTLTAFDGPCTSSDLLTLLVNPLPTLISASTVNVCINESVNLSVAGASNYSWNPAAYLSSSSSSNPVFTPGISTSYTITGTDSNNCYASNIMLVSVLPVPSLTVSSNISVCEGSETKLTASGAAAMVWSPATGLNQTTGTSVTSKPLSITEYSIIGNNGSCSDTASVWVFVLANPTISAGADATMCVGFSTTLTASGTSNITWNPSIGLDQNTGDTVIASPTTTTKYTVVGSDGYCTDTAYVNVSIVSLPVVDAGLDVTIINGKGTTLSGEGSNLTFTWSPSTALSCTDCSNPYANPTLTSTYVLVGTDTYGCSASDDVTVFVEEQEPLCPDAVFVPNAFSPNGDNQNDVLYVSINDKCVKKFAFYIYNRWGEILFETTDITVGWDGKANNKEVNSGVFVYKINITLSNDRPIVETGDLTLVR